MPVLKKTTLERATAYLNRTIATNPELTPNLLNPFSTNKSRRDKVESLLRVGYHNNQFSVPEGDIPQLASYTAGLGPLDALLLDPSVSSIQVMDYNHVLVQRSGVWERVDIAWRSPQQLAAFARSLASRAHYEITEESPVVEATFTDPVGRMQIDTTASNAAQVTMHFRIGRVEPILLDDMIASGMLTREMADFMVEMAHRPVGVLIVGLPGVGKTTFLEALLEWWPMEPFAAIDDQSEFRPRHPWCSTYLVNQSVGANTEDPYTLQKALVASLRKNIQRVAVAEVRGNEAATLLQYSSAIVPWTTIHATLRTAAVRLMTLVKGAPGSPYQRIDEDSIMQSISLAFPLVTEVRKFVIGGQALYRLNGIAYMNPDGSYEHLWQSVYDSNGMFKKFRKGSKTVFDRLHDNYPRSSWGMPNIPQLETIQRVTQDADNTHMAFQVSGALSKIRLHEPRITNFMRAQARDMGDEVQERFRRLYFKDLKRAIREREWGNVLQTLSALNNDNTVGVLGRERMSSLIPEDLEWRVRMLRNVREMLGILDNNSENVETSRSFIRRMSLSILGLYELTQENKEYYPESVHKRVARYKNLVASSWKPQGE